MEEKMLTEKESLALIAGMIQKTKQRTGLDSGTPLLLWGYTTAITAVLVFAALMLTRSHKSMMLWFLIPLVGWPLQHRFVSRKKETLGEAKSYTDIISGRIWLFTSLSELIAFAICAAFACFGHHCVWIMMFIYSLIAVGSASTAQGIIIRENSLVAGGLVGVAGGLVVTACKIALIPLNAAWVMPLFIACFVMMTIVPGHIINRKARRLCSANQTRCTRS